MTRNEKEPSNKTKERYDLFVDCYLQTFNATQSAIKVGYSKKTARQQAHKLLTNAYIKQKIQFEMKRLRNRMKDEGLRSFSMLLDIAMQTEKKIQAHNEAEIEIDRIKSELSDLELEMLKANNDLEKVQKAADAIDGRKKEMRNHKRSLLEQVDSIKKEYFELNLKRVVLLNELSKHQSRYLDAKEWEKLQSLKKSIFQDILDRGGFKAIDQVQHSGKVSVNPLANFSEEELRRLANGPRAT
ncbi:terminase small subunit [Enterococcus faecalis]|uniref:terminase small subunit n=1 Tax=Enterococcus faecalis TaxID=1351 RepID=UPI0003544E0F|nr:terminase small subunit [Enterococcus faecalis]EGO5845995.1 terminase small subunit [Enterococcus faecalis]EPH81652.1 terminase small subunit [Enterococcus faecalis 06-MB-S-10]EPH87034.1 terminase small subunit [Enterococcus faecalis 06-MB-S-04]EPI34004.1 terminase small subunit [Enterococcus faecalis UP2S-6]